MLGLAAAMLGAGSVLGIDIDPKAITLAKKNAETVSWAHYPHPLPQPWAELLPFGWWLTCLLNLISQLDLAEETDWLLADMAQLSRHRETPSNRAPPPQPLDTIVMNPPFGTRRKGIDAVFLRHAIRSVRQGGAVYSLHKSTTRAHLFQLGVDMGARPELLAELRFDIPKMYDFHTQDSQDVAVDLLRFEAGGLLAGVDVPVPEYVPDGEELEEWEKNGGRRRDRKKDGGGGGGGGGRGGGRGRGGSRGKGGGHHSSVAGAAKKGGGRGSRGKGKGKGREGRGGSR